MSVQSPAEAQTVTCCCVGGQGLLGFTVLVRYQVVRNRSTFLCSCTMLKKFCSVPYGLLFADIVCSVQRVQEHLMQILVQTQAVAD